MSTITRDAGHAALPHAGRGETVFAAVAVIVVFLALIAKLAGLFG